MAGFGRERTNSFGVSNGDKQTFVLGNCRQHAAPIADIPPAIPAPSAHGTKVVVISYRIGCDDFR
jgi:hypothetical protein